MIDKIFTLSIIVSTTFGLGFHAPPPLLPYIEQSGVVLNSVRAEPMDTNPRYDYSYSVHDGVTGDQKSHSESRNGNTVQGEYSLVDPDGSLRTVRYIANQDGFNAVVTRNEGFTQPIPTVQVQKVTHEFPAISPSIAFETVNPQPFPVLKRRIVPSTQLIYKNLTPPIKKVYTQPEHIYQQFIPEVPVQTDNFLIPVPQQYPQHVFQQHFPKEPVQNIPIATNPPSPSQPEFQQPEVVEQPIQPIQTPPQFPQQNPSNQDQENDIPLPRPEDVNNSPAPAPILPPQRPPQVPTSPESLPEHDQADDGEAVVVEATPRRANNGNQNNPNNVPSSFTYSSKRGNQHDFRIAY